MAKRFTSEELIDSVNGYRTEVIFWSNNGVRIFAQMEIGVENVTYRAEHSLNGKNVSKVFDNLEDAAIWAEYYQN